MAPFGWETFPWEHSPNLVAGTLLVVLGIAVFAARPGRSVNRSFALVAFCAGLTEFLFGIAARVDELPGRLAPYATIVVPFAATYLTFQMVLCYRAARVSPALRYGVFFALAALCLVFEWLYATRRDLFLVHHQATDLYESGPLDVFSELKYLTFAVLSVAFAIMTRGTKLGLSRRSLAQAAVAFSIMPSYLFAFLPGQFFVSAVAGLADWSILAEPGVLLLVAGGPIVVVAGIILSRHSHRESKAWGRRLLWVAGGAFLTGLSNALLFAYEPFPLWYWPHFFVFGLWYLCMGVLLAAPVLRDRVLDIDLKVERTLQRGMLGAGFLAVVFIASQLVQQGADQYADATGNTVGVITGGVVGGLMLLAIAPLQRLAERMVHRAVPASRPVAAMADSERLSIFEEQTTLAWADGTLTRNERNHLDRLGQHLGIPPAQRDEIERRAMGLTAKQTA